MKHLRWILVSTLAFGVMALSPDSAHAQQDEGEGDSALPTLEDELDLFWAEQRRVRVVQRRAYEKDSRFYVSLFVGFVPNDPYISYFPIGGRFGYWLNEDIGFEIAGSYIGDVFATTSDVGEAFEAQGADFFPRDIQQWRANASVSWSPLYGKFSLLGQRIANFDWTLSAGFGVVGVEGPPSGNLNVDRNTVKPEALLGTGMNFWINDNWALRFDYRQMMFLKTADGVALPSELSIGANLFF